MHRWRAATFAACIAGALVSPVGGAIATNACAASDVHIAVVVDTGSGSSVSAVCVPAGARDNGAVLLATRAAMLGTPPPRYATSGLLCAIDGFPATGCGEPHNGHYSYWSYWHGSSGGAWTYANVGPATSRVDPGVVEGWRWESNGSASPADPPPRVAPVATAICKPAAPPPTAPATTPATARAAGSMPPPATVPRTGVDPAVSPQSSPAPGPGTATAATSRGRNRTSTRPTTPRRPRRSATSSTSVARGAGASAPTTVALAAGGIAHVQHTSGSGGMPVGLIVGGVLVAALFAGGAIAARRRRSPA